MIPIVAYLAELYNEHQNSDDSSAWKINLDFFKNLLGELYGENIEVGSIRKHYDKKLNFMFFFFGGGYWLTGFLDHRIVAECSWLNM